VLFRSGSELISDHSDNNVCNALYRAAYRVKTTI
jgi:hypothetical protein